MPVTGFPWTTPPACRSFETVESNPFAPALTPIDGGRSYAGALRFALVVGLTTLAVFLDPETRRLVVGHQWLLPLVPIVIAALVATVSRRAPALAGVPLLFAVGYRAYAAIRSHEVLATADLSTPAVLIASGLAEGTLVLFVAAVATCGLVATTPSAYRWPAAVVTALLAWLTRAQVEALFVLHRAPPDAKHLPELFTDLGTFAVCALGVVVIGLMIWATRHRRAPLLVFAPTLGALVYAFWLGSFVRDVMF